MAISNEKRAAKTRRAHRRRPSRHPGGMRRSSSEPTVKANSRPLGTARDSAGWLCLRRTQPPAASAAPAPKAKARKGSRRPKSWSGTADAGFGPADLFRGCRRNRRQRFLRNGDGRLAAQEAPKGHPDVPEEPDPAVRLTEMRGELPVRLERRPILLAPSLEHRDQFVGLLWLDRRALRIRRARRSSPVPSGQTGSDDGSGRGAASHAHIRNRPAGSAAPKSSAIRPDIERSARARIGTRR